MAKIGRPKTQIDLELAHRLGLNQCTLEECSAWLGVPVSTLSTHAEFSEAYKKGKQKGKLSLRRYQWELAKTNATMAIFLGKQYLGQMDIPMPGDDTETAQALKHLAGLIDKAQKKYDKAPEGAEMAGDGSGDDAGATSSLASGRQGAGGSDAAPLPVKAKKKGEAAKVKAVATEEKRARSK